MDQTTAAARTLAARRKRIEKTCEVCQKSIEGIARRRYCSNTCAVRASRGRRREVIDSSAKPDIVQELNTLRAAIMHGRTFAGTSADLVHEAREERAAAL